MEPSQIQPRLGRAFDEFPRQQCLKKRNRIEIITNINLKKNMAQNMKAYKINFFERDAIMELNLLFLQMKILYLARVKISHCTLIYTISAFISI